METAIATFESSLSTAGGTGQAVVPLQKPVWRWAHPVDIRHAAAFHAAAMETLKSGRKGPLILDLSESTVVDACGLQILVAIAIEALSKGRFFEIANASQGIQQDLRLAGVSYLLQQQD